MNTAAAVSTIETLEILNKRFLGRNILYLALVITRSGYKMKDIMQPRRI